MDSGDLEANVVEYLLVSAIFIVAAFNLVNFPNGRIFSLIFLIISTILLITIIFEYFDQKNKLKEVDQIRPAISILMYAVIAFAIINIIIIYQMIRELWKSYKMVA